MQSPKNMFAEHILELIQVVNLVVMFNPVPFIPDVTAGVHLLAVNSSGKYFATGDHSNNVHVYSLKRLKVIGLTLIVVSCGCLNYKITADVTFILPWCCNYSTNHFNSKFSCAIIKLQR